MPARVALKVFTCNDPALEQAIETMLCVGGAGLRQTAERFGVDKDTLARRLKKFREVLGTAWVACGLKPEVMVVRGGTRGPIENER